MRPSVLFALTVAFTASLLAQAPPNDPPEKKAVLELVRAYEAAYAKGDGKVLAGFFAPDASYTSETGQVFHGVGEIESAIVAGLQANRGSKLTIDVGTVRARSERDFRGR